MEVATYFIFFLFSTLFVGLGYWFRNFFFIFMASFVMTISAVLVWTEGLTTTTAGPSGLVTAVFQNEYTVGFGIILTLTAFYLISTAVLTWFNSLGGDTL